MGGGGDNEVQETADQIQAAKNNTEMWNYVKTTYKPFMDKFIGKTEAAADSGAAGKQVAGQINASVMKNATEAGTNSNITNPVAAQKVTDAAAGLKTDATISAQGRAKLSDLKKLENIVDIGRGQKTTADSTQDQIAASSLNAATREKMSDLETQGQIENSLGSLAGAGAAAYRRNLSTPNFADDATFDAQKYTDAYGSNVTSLGYGRGMM